MTSRFTLTFIAAYVILTHLPNIEREKMYTILPMLSRRKSRYAGMGYFSLR